MTRTTRTTVVITMLSLLLATALAMPAWGADPSRPTGSFSMTGPLGEARVGHTATLLPDGRVLVVGGYGRAIPRGSGPYRPDTTPPPTDPRASAEIWDPATGTFEPTGSLAGPRAGHTATLLPYGRVLVIGGGAGDSWLPLATAEVWDPATGAFTSAGALTTARRGHTVTLLPDGRVLVVGGNDPGLPEGSTTLTTVEIWDPATGAFAPSGALGLARTAHTATLLRDGRVLVVGGLGPLEQAGWTAEVWDPVSGMFTPAGDLTVSHGVWHTATLLEDGRVAVMGGYAYNDTDTNQQPTEVEVWDPATDGFTLSGSLSDWRYSHQAVLLQDGRVLLVGGVTPSSGTEVWDPATGATTPAVPPTAEVLAGTVTLLPDGRVLVAGGHAAWTLDTALLWDPATGTTGPAGVMHEARQHHTATLLPDGRVLVIGGLQRTQAAAAAPDEPDRVLASAEVWEPEP